MQWQSWALGLVLLAAALRATAAGAESERVVVCLGDSVTLGVSMRTGQSYPEVLQRLCDEHYGGGVARVVNAGIGGNTSAQGVARLEADVLRPAPASGAAEPRRGLAGRTLG